MQSEISFQSTNGTEEGFFFHEVTVGSPAPDTYCTIKINQEKTPYDKEQEDFIESEKTRKSLEVSLPPEDVKKLIVALTFAVSN